MLEFNKSVHFLILYDARISRVVHFLSYTKAVKLTLTSVSVQKGTVRGDPAGIQTRGLLLIRQVCYQPGHPTDTSGTRT